MTGGIGTKWADRFGLAHAPLFGRERSENPDDHAVLLDGGSGSFALSETKEKIWRGPNTASWAWSSDLPHHVTVTDKIVAVKRWDRIEVEELSRSSVEPQLDSFYEYLGADEVRSTLKVTNYVLRIFRGIRALVANSDDISDEESLGIFLAFLDTLVEKKHGAASPQQSPGAKHDKLHEIPEHEREALMRDIESRVLPMKGFELFPLLAVRHAGSNIFQEAHFELTRIPGVDLFGYPGLAKAQPIQRSGVHFTPPPIARSVAENTLKQINNLAERKMLTVLDPACGSGAFLHEVVRSLKGMEFHGRLKLIGRDISPAAVAMAKFVVNHTINDWKSDGEAKFDIDIKEADSLAEPLPQADVVIMNPPFIAWNTLNSEQRDLVRLILASQYDGHADLSMAFVRRAIDSLKEGGALGTLLPASLLTLQSAEKWRKGILERVNLRLLASLEDYNLFAPALVQVAVAVMVKSEVVGAERETLRAVVSANSATATGNALRMLRRMHKENEDKSPDGSWRIFRIRARNLKMRPTWRLTPPETEMALSKLLEAGALKISRLFNVREGIKTGKNKAFLLDEAKFKALPRRERCFFRQSIMNDSIQEGKILKPYWVFYPYDDPKTAIKEEGDLREKLPNFLERHLEPHREELAARSSLRPSLNWWDLSENRVSWIPDKKPRIISKRFGGRGGFAVDPRAEFGVVQGYAWRPAWEAEIAEESDSEVFSTVDLLYGYSALFNSHQFSRVLKYYSPHVSGGQFDLSARYVKHVLVPNLRELARDERAGDLVSELVDLGRKTCFSNTKWIEKTDQIVTEFYGNYSFEDI